jgi:hypothetical protein
MELDLDAIKFNHDPATAHGDAINLRKNASEFITVPEWRAGISITPEDSRAAYAKKEVARKPLHPVPPRTDIPVPTRQSTAASNHRRSTPRPG